MAVTRQRDRGSWRRWSVACTAGAWLPLLGLACSWSRPTEPLPLERLRPIWSRTLVSFEPQAAVPWDGGWLVAGTSSERSDPAGEIRWVDPDGVAADPPWATGLRAPGAMATDGVRVLVVSDDQLVELDPSSRRVTRRTQFPARLDDVTIAPNGDVFLASKSSSAVYRQSGDETALWFESPILPAPSAVTAESLFLVVHASGFLHRLAYGSKNAQRATHVGSPMSDVLSDGAGGYWYCDWTTGAIGRVRPSGHVHPLQELPLIRSIAYDPESRVLLAITPRGITAFRAR